MTTTVKIEAHCASNKEVVVETQDGEYGNAQTLQDGASTIVYAYDAKRIIVYEREKAAG